MFSNLFHMELIRYIKNKSAMASVIVTLFLCILADLFLKLELAIVADPAFITEEISLSLQAFAIQFLASMFALMMGISVVLTTTSFYKNRIYYNVNGVISSRFKLFLADMVVLLLIAATGSAAIMAYLYVTGRYVDSVSLLDMNNITFVLCTLFVFCRIFFCILGGYALSHFLRSAVTVFASALGIQIFQFVLFMATSLYLNLHLGDNPEAVSVFHILGSLESPSQALIVYACGTDMGMTPMTLLAITSIPFAIIFIVAAVAAGRRIEV